MSRSSATSPSTMPVLRRFLHWAVACVLLAALLQAGSRRLFCTMTGTVLDAPCCTHGGTRGGDEAALRESGPDCCAVFSVDRLPSSTAGDVTAKAPPPAVAAVLPAAPLSRGLALASRRTPPSRACGPPASPAQTQTRLMVFLI